MATIFLRKTTGDVISLGKRRHWGRLSVFRPYSARSSELFPQRLNLPDNHGYVPTLSPLQITSLLRINETSLENNFNPSSHVIRGYASNQLGSNYPCEDRRGQAQVLQTGGSLFAVFDGHGGIACAQAVSERLFDYIAVALLNPEQLEKFSHALRTDGSMDLLKWHRNLNDYRNEEMALMYRSSLQKFVVMQLSMSGFDDTDGQVKSALKLAFRQLDDDMSAESLPQSGAVNLEALEVGLSGSCCCLAHIHDLQLNVANLGDCRAVLGQCLPDGSWVAKPLSVDHNTTNEDECNRVRSEHSVSESSFILKNSRLLGSLIPLRAFGDFRYKWSLHELKSLVNILDNVYAQNIIPMNYYTPPYLINKPQVIHHELTPKDRFLVLATDGLWEQIDNEQVVRLVADYIEGKETAAHFRLPDKPMKLSQVNELLQKRKSGLANKNVDDNVATHLLRYALGSEHRKVSEMLTLPPEVVRYYRDDITATVIFFDNEFIENYEQ